MIALPLKMQYNYYTDETVNQFIFKQSAAYVIVIFIITKNHFSVANLNPDELRKPQKFFRGCFNMHINKFCYILIKLIF